MRIRWKNCIVITCSSAVLAFGLYHVHAQTDITEGGILGLTLLLERWFSISPSVSGLFMNLACYLFGWRVLGKAFIVYSMVSAAAFSASYAVFECFPPLWPQLYGHPLLAAVLGALFVGIGVGAAVRMGAAPGGDDALAMGIQKLTNIKLEQIYLMSDILVLGLSLSYIPWQRLIYSLVTVVLSGQIVGFVQRVNVHRDKDCRETDPDL